MTLPDQVKVIYGIISVNLLIGAQAINVYMDKYGHCSRNKDFELDDDVYTILPKGGGMKHETLNCDLTFKARMGHGVCITFQKFSISDCGVKLKIFDKSTASGRSWKTLGCDDESPKRMCTGKRYVTVALHKRMLNNNRRYTFNIDISDTEQPVTYISGQAGGDSGEIDPDTPPDEASIGETFTGEDVFFASLGIFVAIIVGVIVLIITIAVLIICCCCKGQRRQQGQRYQATSTTPPPPQTQPSAPPAPTEYFASQASVPPLYPTLPPTYHRSEAPPPYTPQAPSYVQQGYAPQSAYTGEPETKQPMAMV